MSLVHLTSFDPARPSARSPRRRGGVDQRRAARAGRGAILESVRRRSARRRSARQQQQQQYNPFGGFFGGPQEEAGGAEARTIRGTTGAAPRAESAAAITSPILVLGDAMADWLAYGLEDAFSEKPEFGIVRKHRTYAGLVRYDPRRDVEWPQIVREAIAADKPNSS